MPEGLQYALSAKISSGPRPRVSIVTYDMGPSLYSGRYIQEALTNSLDLEDSNKRHMHLLLFANDVNSFELNRRNDVTVYDFVRNPVVNLENLYETLSGNVISRPGRSHILIIDDYSLFSILATARNAKLQAHFLRGISKRFRKIFIFFGKNSLATDEIGVIYDAATEIAYLQSVHEITGGVSSNDGPEFTCDLLKIRSDRRVSHEKTVFQVVNNELQEKLVYDTIDKRDNSGTEVLKNLTTFKLTLEDDERESKNSLHLPYFEAQKTSLEDPENFDDFDEDEEDEEV